MINQSRKVSEVEWLCIDVDWYKMTNVYKPPSAMLTPTTIPAFAHPCLYEGDFNCQNTDWGYNTPSQSGEHLSTWAMNNCQLNLAIPSKRQRELFYSDAGTQTLIQIWSLAVQSTITNYYFQTDACWKNSLNLNTDLHS